MDDVAIKIDHVSKDFRLPHERAESVKSLFVNPFRGKGRHKIETQHALDDIDFEVKKGEFFGVVGRNGSGKSTLLKIIAGIYQPTKGSVAVNGRLVPFIELGVGFNPELTGRENVYLNGALLGFSTKEVDHKYKRIVDFAELEKFMDQKLKNYSSGMQVRLAFSVATILAESDILLIDEVLAVGDADFQRKCFNYFRTLKKEKKTVIFVSHDMTSVREYCDRAILLDKSKLINGGSSLEIANEYTKLFIDKTSQEYKGQGLKSDKRSGNLKVEYTSTQFDKKDYTDDDPEILLKVQAKARENVSNVIFGFKIKNAADQLLTGSNTEMVQNKTINLKKDQQVELTWVIENIFNDGTYYTDIAIESSDRETFDWIEDAGKFSVVLNNKTGFLVNPDVKLETNLK